MNSLNLCQFIGNLGRDPEIRYTQDGKAVANLSLGVNWKSKNSEGTEWIRASAFGQLAEIIEKYLHKGSKVYISGRMQTRKWQGQDGQDRYTTEIMVNNMQMLDSKGSQPQQGGGQPQQPQQGSAQQGGGNFDDDIPFARVHFYG